jgi:hypothetical protein
VELSTSAGSRLQVDTCPQPNLQPTFDAEREPWRRALHSPQREHCPRGPLDSLPRALLHHVVHGGEVGTATEHRVVDRQVAEAAPGAI